MENEKITEIKPKDGSAQIPLKRPCYPCRFCDERTPGVKCGNNGTFFVSMPNRHQLVVCDKHVGRYRDDDGVRGRKRFDGRYMITPVLV